MILKRPNYDESGEWGKLEKMGNWITSGSSKKGRIGET